MKISQGASDLFHSERGVFCVALLFLATALVAIGKLDVQAWIDFMKYLGGLLVASKTVTTAIDQFQSRIPPARVVKDGESP